MHRLTDPDDLVDALLSASRALLGVAAYSVADLGGDITLPQYRALVVLAGRGPQRGVDLAAELGVNPSTATRLIDRLARAELVERQPVSGDRRAVRVGLLPAGRRVVDEASARRRARLHEIVAGMPAGQRAAAVAALRAFAEAAGEVPDHRWWSGPAGPDEDR